jgi:type II secretory pathway component PulK
MSGEYYEKIKDAVTVYGSGIVNINTASREVLGILCAGFAAQLSLDPALGDGVADKLVKERTGRGFWAEKNDIALPLTTAEEQNIFNRLLGQADIISENFLIEATGNIGTIKRTISAVYNRKKHRILSWHEY